MKIRDNEEGRYYEVTGWMVQQIVGQPCGTEFSKTVLDLLMAGF